MPSLDFLFLNKLKLSYSLFPNFIETGTYMGNTIFEMEKYFEELHTIELSKYYYNHTKNKYNGNKINFYFGDSSKVLTDILPLITKPTIFFLDGHWSSGDTAKGDKDCPLKEELISINKYFLQNGIIIIDDCRLFGKCKKTGNNEDWSDITKDNLLKIINERITDYYFLDSDCSKDDRLIIHIKNI
jgi:hypothetical protein